MEWTSNTNNKKLKLLVVAIDIGATYSGCSCLTRVDFEKCKAGNNLNICFPIWKGVGESSRKAPTSVLFRPNKTFHSFGFDAEQYYKENSGTLEFKEWYFFKNFKTKLNIVKGVLIKDTIKEHNKEAGRSMKALDVFGSVIKYYKDHILQCFKDRPNYLNDIHWVITVPPSWGFKAKQLMKDAADQAGIYNDQLTLALEPEAACSYCPVSAESTTDVGKAIAEMQIGEQVIVCNCGGATTDLTVYEVTGPKMLKKIDQAYGGHYGGNTVNAELFKILTILFSGPVIKEIRDKYPSEYLDFQTNIEHKLTSFYVHKEPMVTIRVPLEWKVVFEHCTGETLEEALLNSSYKRKVYLYGDKLRINNDIFRQFIDFSTNYVLGLIEELFRKPATTNVTTLLAVGDDFEPSILINAITQKFPNLTVIVPEDPDIAVLKGAVLYGFEPYKFTRMEHKEKGEKLAETLRGLGLEDVIDLQDIFNENYQKSFWNRVYLVGPHSVGKSCLAKILVGEPVLGTRQSTDGIWIYMGKAGMDIDKMEWVFFPKGNAITEVLTNMLMSMSTYEEQRNGNDSFVDVPLYESTQTNERVKFDGSTETIQISSQIVSATHDIDTYETLHTMKDQKLEENSSSDFDLEDHIHQNTSLKNQKEKDASCIEKNKEKKQNFKVVSNNSECEWMKEITANMSPDKIHELIVKAVQEGKYKQMIVPIDIWDFGGQKDYYMTHQLFITSRGIFVLMFNGSIGLHQHMPGLNFLPGHFGKPTVAVYLLHWVNSILTYCNRTDDGFPKIIFVATHKDERWFQWTQEARRTHLENELQQLFETHGGLKHLEFKPLIFVDATNPDDAEITDLRERIMQRATEHPRWGEAMPTRWIPLELLLAQKSAEGTNIISYDQLLVLNSKNESMILSERQLATFLKVQHSLGKLLYFDVENLRGFIILSPAYLVEVLRSIVTEKQFWPKGEMYSKILINLQETGMIERDDIYYLWQQDDFKHIMSYKEYMIQILVHLDVFIAPKTSLENLNVSIQDVSHFLVPCMITKENDTMFLKRFQHSNSSIVIAYTFIEEVIPPALSYRFLSSLIASWDIKNYKGKYREKRMLFSDLAVVKIDNFHDVAVQVKTNKIIVSLIHAKTKEDIIPTLASSLQECLTATIVGISKFYSKLSEGVPSQNEKSAVPFNIEFGVFCESDMCFFNHNEMSMSTGEPIWMCKKHKQRHTIKFLSIWFSEKETREYEPNIDVCTSFCRGLGRLEMERCPLPHHVRRLAAQLSIDECRDIAIMLGSKLQEWDDLVYEFERQPANDLKFISLWSCIMKSVNFSFGSLQIILEKEGRSAHLLCELFRDVRIDVSDMSEDTLNKIPSVDALHELSNHIGNINMQLAIELEVDVSFIQQTQYNHKNKLIDQTRIFFLKWRHDKYPKPTVLRLLKALHRVGLASTYQVLQNYI